MKKPKEKRASVANGSNILYVAKLVGTRNMVSIHEFSRV